MNDVDVTLEQGAFLVKDNIYEIEEDENKIKRFLKGY